MSRATIGRILLGIGALGVVLSVLGIVAGLRLVSGFDATLDDSISLTAEALDVVDESVEVTDGVVLALTEALGRSASTMRQLATGFGDAVAVLDATADLTEDELAASLEAVDRSLPALIDVAAVIDRTLSALSVAPFGPDYDPPERFDDSLRAIQGELAGLPTALREQARLTRDAADSLRDVQRGTAEIARDVSGLETTLREASDLLEGYSSTTASARRVVDDGAEDLDGQLALVRILLVAIGLTVAVAQVVPLAAGWLLLRPEVARDLETRILR